MGDDTTQPGAAFAVRNDVTDITDNSLITDISQMVSSVVGKERNERRRQKLRDELVRDYISGDKKASSSLSSQVFRLFKRD